MAKRPEYIVVGRFGRPRGISGAVHITPATDDPQRFLALTEFIAVGRGRRERLEIEHLSLIGGRPVVKIKGIDNREGAARLTNMSIEIPIKDARPLPEGSYYQFDLAGCRVIGSDGTEYGVLEEVLFYPGNDLYRIVSERFGEVLLPAVDRFIIEVNLEEKKVVIDPPEGLFEV